MRMSFTASTLALLSVSSMVFAQASMPPIATSFGAGASAHPLRTGRYAMTLSRDVSAGCSLSFSQDSARVTSVLSVTRTSATLCLRAHTTRRSGSRADGNWPNFSSQNDYEIGVGYRGRWRDDHGVAHFTLTPDASVCGAQMPERVSYQPIAFDCIEVQGHPFSQTVATPLVACRAVDAPLPSPFAFEGFGASVVENSAPWMLLSSGNGLALDVNQGMWDRPPLAVTTSTTPITP